MKRKVIINYISTTMEKIVQLADVGKINRTDKCCTCSDHRHV